MNLSFIVTHITDRDIFFILVEDASVYHLKQFTRRRASGFIDVLFSKISI